MSTRPRTRRRRRRLGAAQIVGIVFGVGYFAFSLFPILWVALLSIKDRNDAVAFPPPIIFEPTLDAFRQLLGAFEYEAGSAEAFASSTDFPQLFLNSLIVSTAATFVALAVGVPAAYALARMRAAEWVKANLLFTFLSFRFLPEFAILVPIYALYQQLGLTNSYLGLIWVYQLIGIPFVVLILRTYFDDIPIELDESARVDGATTWGIFRRVALPLSVPALVAAGTLSFIFCWNNFVFAVVLGGTDTAPVTVVAINYLSAQETALSQMAAATVLAATPSIVLAFLIYRYLVRGLTLGAVRG